MKDDKKGKGWDGSGAHIGNGFAPHLFIKSEHPPGTELSKPIKKRRRRAGYLNDGQWAPGYGPDGKKK